MISNSRSMLTRRGMAKSIKAVGKAIANRETLTPEHGETITREHYKRKKAEAKAKEKPKTSKAK